MDPAERWLPYFMRVHNRGLVLIALLACAASGRGQSAPATPRETEFQRVLEKLGEAAVELEHSLPSFTCDEDAMSQEVRDEKVKSGVAFTATMRAVRKADGSLEETFEVKSVDGKPFRQGHFHTPAYLHGGFDSAMRYFAPDQQFCYVFALKARSVEFADTGQARCRDKGMRGVAVLDDGDAVVHMERSVPLEVAKVTGLAQFVAVDFADVLMNGKAFRLPHHVVAEMTQGRSVGRFEATYSNCRQFKTTVTIGPAEALP